MQKLKVIVTKDDSQISPTDQDTDSEQQQLDTKTMEKLEDMYVNNFMKVYSQRIPSQAQRLRGKGPYKHNITMNIQPINMNYLEAIQAEIS